jgi:hypothetical protein
LHGISGVTAKGVLIGRARESNLWKLCSVRVKRIKLHLCAGRDGTTMEDAFAVHEVNGDGSASIDNDHRLLDRCIGSSCCKESILPWCGIFINTATDRNLKVTAKAPDIGVKFCGKLCLNSRRNGIVDACDHDFALAIRFHLVSPLLDSGGDDSADIAVYYVLDNMEFVTVEVTDRCARIADADCKKE